MKFFLLVIRQIRLLKKEKNGERLSINPIVSRLNMAIGTQLKEFLNLNLGYSS
jgi:hypothetical protein